MAGAIIRPQAHRTFVAASKETAGRVRNRAKRYALVVGACTDRME